MKNRKVFFVFSVRYSFSFVLLQLYCFFTQFHSFFGAENSRLFYYNFIVFLLSSTHFLVLKTFEVKVIQAHLLGLK